MSVENIKRLDDVNFIVFVVNRYILCILYTSKVFQLTRFSHNVVFSKNQNARYAGTRYIPDKVEALLRTLDGKNTLLNCTLPCMC